MTWQNMIALAIFVGVCGFIAYWGDLLGRRMGKRRLSLFGLRPRYTAIMTTTITGMLIAAFTIAVMAGASREARDLVLRGSEIVHEYRAAREESVRARMELSAAKAEADKAVRQRNVLSSDIVNLTKTSDTLKADLLRNQTELASAEKQLASAKKDIADRRAEIAAQKIHITQLRETQRKLEKDVDIVGTGYASLFEKNVIFRPYQEIARRVINCAQPRPEIRASFTGLLDDAGAKAKAKGASIGKNKLSIRFLPKKIANRRYEESEITNAIIDQIDNGTGFVVARIFSDGNAFEGRQAVVDCELIRNKVVYSKGEEVASTTIDGGAERGQIFGALIAFLKSDVRSTAERKGILPSYDEEGQPSVGEITGDKLFELVDRIKSAGKPVRVRALAAKETWSAGPLRLNLVSP